MVGEIAIGSIKHMKEKNNFIEINKWQQNEVYNDYVLTTKWGIWQLNRLCFDCLLFIDDEGYFSVSQNEKKMCLTDQNVSRFRFRQQRKEKTVRGPNINIAVVRSLYTQEM